MESVDDDYNVIYECAGLMCAWGERDRDKS